MTAGESIWDEFRASCSELETWLRARLEAHGVEFVCSDAAPDTFEALMAAPEVIPVPPFTGRPDTIYSDGGQAKRLYRAFHDHVHRARGFDFSEYGEWAVALDHQAEGAATGLSRGALELLWVESWLRVRYFFRWGRYPRNEALLHWLARAYGYECALGAEGL